MVDAHCVHKNAHTHVLMHIKQVYCALKSRPGRAFWFGLVFCCFVFCSWCCSFIHNCDLLFILPIKNIPNGQYSLFMSGLWWLFRIPARLCLKLRYFPVYSHYLSTACTIWSILLFLQQCRCRSISSASPSDLPRFILFMVWSKSGNIT